MSNQEVEKSYQYPNGYFITSSFKTDATPSAEETKAQDMVIKGLRYLDGNPEYHKTITEEGKSLYKSSSFWKPMALAMTDNEKSTFTELMFDCACHAYYAKAVGWETYISYLKTKAEYLNK